MADAGHPLRTALWPLGLLYGTVAAVKGIHLDVAEGELDSAGRVRIPGHLVEAAGLKGSCTVIGAGEYLEIWDTDEWNRENERLQSEFSEIAEGMSEARA